MTVEEITKRGKLIGKGVTADVYLLDGFAYKCFSPAFPQFLIDHELNMTRLAADKGLPAARCYDSGIERCIKLDYIDGKNLAERMREDKYTGWTDDIIDLCDLVHTADGEGLPPLRESILSQISENPASAACLPLATRCAALIADENVFCHLDLHFLNVIFSDGKYVIIDWINSRRGNPIYDFARSYVIAYEFANRISGKLCRRIMERCGYTPEQFDIAVYVIAAHRLSEHDSEKMRLLTEQTAQKLLQRGI